MELYYSAAIMGVVEGLTEFLPVSSTGHLILAGHLLDLTGAKAKTFDVVIQLGAILAVLVMYFGRFWGLLRTDPRQRFSGPRGIYLLFLTSLPAGVVGLIAHSAIKKHLFAPQPVAWALAVGALAILAVEAFRPRSRYMTLDEVTPRLALAVGLFQCLAMWPGFSRSAATIMGAMLFGADRKLAAEYSFIAAVPIMFAASGLDLYKNLDVLSLADLPFFATGFGVAFISAWVAVKLFIGLVQRVSLRPFAYYRLALAPLVFFFWK